MQAGFFDRLQTLIHGGIETIGVSHVAFVQFAASTFLSAILDNNVVADFASRALHGLDIGVLHLFAMAQIAGYAVGGCWTHIGSAQSVVAYGFIRRDVDEKLYAGAMDKGDDSAHSRNHGRRDDSDLLGKRSPRLAALNSGVEGASIWTRNKLFRGAASRSR